MDRAAASGPQFQSEKIGPQKCETVHVIPAVLVSTSLVVDTERLHWAEEGITKMYYVADACR